MDFIMDISGKFDEGILVIAVIILAVGLVIEIVQTKSYGFLLIMIMIIGIISLGLGGSNGSKTSDYDAGEEMVLETKIQLGSIKDSCYLCESQEGWMYRRKGEVSLKLIKEANIGTVPINSDQEPYVEIYRNKMNPEEKAYIFHIPEENK